MGGATPEAVTKYIEDNKLDDGAAQLLRSLAPHQQNIAIRWDLSSFKNPSAKFMAKANSLGIPPKMGMPMPMVGVPPMMVPMGMPPMGIPPGMQPMGVAHVMPGMAPVGMSSQLDGPSSAEL